MPIIKSAIKRAKQTVKRHERNVSVKRDVKEATKAFLAAPSATTLSKAQSAIDTAVKKNILEKNTASRRKANLSKTAKAAGVKIAGAAKAAPKATAAKPAAAKKPAAVKATPAAAKKAPAKKPAAKKPAAKKYALSYTKTTPALGLFFIGIIRVMLFQQGARAHPLNVSCQHLLSQRPVARVVHLENQVV